MSPLIHANNKCFAYAEKTDALVDTSDNHFAGRRQHCARARAGGFGHDDAEFSDPVDGRILWEYPWPGSMPKCAQPVVVGGDRVFLSASFNAGSVLLQVKKGTDGSFAATEVWKNRNLPRYPQPEADAIENYETG